MKKGLLLISILLLAGCASKDLNNSYEKMQIGQGKINGYRLDLRISGTINDKTVSEIVNVQNYNNKNYKITIETNRPHNNVNQIDPNTVYIIDGNVYAVGDNNKYMRSDNKVKYNNPSIYLDGLNNIKKAYSKGKEKIDNITYQKYNVVIDKDFGQKIIDDTMLPNIKITKDFNATVYLDDNGYVNRIIYYINDVIINANYYNINESRPIVIPINF